MNVQSTKPKLEHTQSYLLLFPIRNNKGVFFLGSGLTAVFIYYIVSPKTYSTYSMPTRTLQETWYVLITTSIISYYVNCFCMIIYVRSETTKIQETSNENKNKPRYQYLCWVLLYYYHNILSIVSVYLSQDTDLNNNSTTGVSPHHAIQFHAYAKLVFDQIYRFCSQTTSYQY